MPHKYNLDWWGPPRNFSDRKNTRKISWLELFYDLVYVAAVGQLTHCFAEHPSWENAGKLFLFFSLIFWSWVNGSQYYDLHGSDSIRTRLQTFWQILCVAAIAITLQDAFEGNLRGLTMAFSMLEIVITYLWWSVGLYDRSHRVFNKFYTVNYLLAFGLMIFSLALSYQQAIAIWIIVLVLNITPPLTGARTVVNVLKSRGQVFSASEAIVERFGLFTIIVLAESILATVNAVAEVKDKHPAVWAGFILTILISFLLWSLYFDMTSEQDTKKGYSYLQYLIFLHFPLLASYCIAGASIKSILANTDVLLSMDLQWIFCISIAIILLSIVALTYVMEENAEDRVYIGPVSRLLLLISALVLSIPIFGQYLTNISFLCIICILLFVPVFIGIRRWVSYKYGNK
ncbi:MAG: hypothetical protein BGO70_00085 [Bacteroidetes bacterium 43-93]|nr:low temperature requirement protein A [Bacteroidota bacterium]OJW95726.1 MAG: hypothetical protein BGO70_00085 [Bacteroidetes bacterium 43-93]